MTKLVSFYKKYHLIEDDSMSHEDERRDTPMVHVDAKQSVKELRQRRKDLIGNNAERKKATRDSLPEDEKAKAKDSLLRTLADAHKGLGDAEPLHHEVSELRNTLARFYKKMEKDF